VTGRITARPLDSFDYFGCAQYKYASFDELRAGKTSSLGVTQTTASLYQFGDFAETGVVGGSEKLK